jgi:hypothetical protein
LCVGYLEAQVSKENSVNIQQAIGGLMDELPKGGVHLQAHRYLTAKGAAIVVCQDEETWDWLGSKVPTLKAWEDS